MPQPRVDVNNTASQEKTYILARQDRIPVWPHSTSLLWVLGAGYFFAFFDIINIGAALPEIAQPFGISTSLASWAVTASLLSYIIGSYIDGVIAPMLLSWVASFAAFAGALSLMAISGLIVEEHCDCWHAAWRVRLANGAGSRCIRLIFNLRVLQPA